MTMKMVASERCWPKACSAAPRARATMSWPEMAPPTSSTNFAGRLARIFRSPRPDGVSGGPCRRPAGAGADGDRHADQDDHEHDDGQEQPDRLAVVARGVLSVVGEVHVAPRQGREIRKRAPFTIQLIVLTKAPEVTAWVASKPCCWKKRRGWRRWPAFPGQRREGIGKFESHHPPKGSIPFTVPISDSAVDG